MHFAASKGQLEVIELMLGQADSTCLNLPEACLRMDSTYLSVSDESREQNYPIHVAAKFGHLDIVQRLYPISKLVTPSGYTILHSAVEGRNLKLIRWILDQAELSDLINQRSQDCASGELKCNLLHAQTIDGETPLHIAVRIDDLECIDYLIQRGASVTQTIDDGSTIYHLATFYDYKSLKHLLTLGIPGIETPNASGLTPLHEAAMICYPEGLETILAEISTQKIDAVDSNGISALRYVIAAGRQYEPHIEPFSLVGRECVEILRACGASTDFSDLEELQDFERKELNRPLSDQTILSIRNRIYFDRSLTFKLLCLY